MDALQLYDGILREIHQFNVRVFDYADFNYWWNKTVRESIDGLMSRRETPLSIDDLAALLKRQELGYNPTNKGEAVRAKDLPEDYFHMAPGEQLVQFRFVTAALGYKADDRVLSHARRLPEKLEGYAQDNHWMQPSLEEPYYRRVGNQLAILYHGTRERKCPYLVEKVELRYVRQPVIVKLNEDYTIHTNTDLPLSFNEKILKRCVVQVLENAGSPRLQTHTIVNS